MRILWQVVLGGAWIMTFGFAFVCVFHIIQIAAPLFDSNLISYLHYNNELHLKKNFNDATPSSPTFVAPNNINDLNAKAQNQTDFSSEALNSRTDFSEDGIGSHYTPLTSDASISHTVSAISAAIAAVTLVITLGSSWIARTSVDIHDTRKKVNKLHQNILDSRRKHIFLLNHLLEVKNALRRYIECNGTTANAWSQYTAIAIQLERLMSTDPESRFSAFGLLLLFFQDIQDEQLKKALDIYTQNIHEWLILIDAAPDQNTPSWCLIFSTAQQNEWAKRNMKQQNGEFVLL